MEKILFATKNIAKKERFAKKLENRGVELISLLDLDIKLEDVEENGKSAIENALIKARSCYAQIKMNVIAMDDTLYLENVPEKFQPGMYVRRVNGKTLTDKEMIEYYTDLVKKYGTNGKLNIKWVYGLALIKDGVEKTITWTKSDSYFIDTPSKIIKKGYPLSSISINKKLNKYFTDITEEDKLLLEDGDAKTIEFIVNNIK